MFEFVETCPICYGKIERGQTICEDPRNGLSAHAGCVAKFERDKSGAMGAEGGES